MLQVAPTGHGPRRKSRHAGAFPALLTELLLEVSGGQNDGSGGDTPSRHPAAAAPRVGAAK
jgi:hypothetical protein